MARVSAWGAAPDDWGTTHDDGAELVFETCDHVVIFGLNEECGLNDMNGHVLRPADASSRVAVCVQPGNSTMMVEASTLLLLGRFDDYSDHDDYGDMGECKSLAFA